MSSRVRKFALTAHVVLSVGWLGSVAGFLVLAIVGLKTQDVQLARACYASMDVMGWYVIVPLALASLPSGLIMSFGTEWGLFRHYWVIAKLLISTVSTGLLLLHMQPIGHLAQVVAERTLQGGELAGLRVQLTADAAAALLALITATVFSVYKPRGVTPYGRRRLREQL